MGNSQPGPDPNVMRVFLASDIHTDEQENWDLVQEWANKFEITSSDVLILAGDISHHLDVVEGTCNFPQLIYYLKSHQLFCLQFQLNIKAHSDDVYILYNQNGIINDFIMLETFTVLKQVFTTIFFVPGNNELRLRKEEHEKKVFNDSVHKFHHVLDVCKKFGKYIPNEKFLSCVSNTKLTLYF
jgi:Icc-related predicted phosphoesterase